jgi:membrane protein implicated in regulation of membrane protease activity
MFGVWLMAVRYGQIHFAMDRELLLPIVALVFSLLSIVLVWRFYISRKKTPDVEPSAPVEDHHEPSHKKHHSPNISDS